MSQCDLNNLLELYQFEKLLKPDTLRSYRYVIKVFIRDTRTCDLQVIDRLLVLKWRELVIERASESTWNTYLRQLRALGNYAVKRELWDANVFKDVEFVRQKKKRKKTVAAATLKLSISALDDRPCRYDPVWFWKILLKTLYYTGMRRRQVVGLRWSDLDFVNKTILLRAETSKTQREWMIPMFNAEAGLAELKFRTQQLEQGVRIDDQVFNVTLFSERFEAIEMNLDQVSRFFRKLNNDIPTSERISAHRLRHTFGTHVSQAGDIKTLQEIMGHRDIRTTSEYIHPDLAQMEVVGGAMPEL